LRKVDTQISRQSQPDTEAIENSQIRTSDGNGVFSPGLFGAGIAIPDVKYQMATLDAGIKYKGLALESELYWRTVSNLRGPGTDSLSFRDMHDSGFKVEVSSSGGTRNISSCADHPWARCPCPSWSAAMAACSTAASW